MINLGMLNILGNIINKGEINSDYVIAKCFLENITLIDELTVNQIMEEAFVSRSSIRRFCQKLGFDNFSKLKESLTDIIFPSNLHLRNFDSTSSYRVKLNDGISGMIHDITNTVSNDTIEYLTELINNYDNVVFLSANNTSMNLEKFQQELFFAGKIIQVIGNHASLVYESQQLVNDNTLIITVSISGIFAKAAAENVINMEGKKILITANHSKEFLYLYDEVFYISEYDITNDRLGLLGKYGITYLLDLISQEYIYKYQ